MTARRLWRSQNSIYPLKSPNGSKKFRYRPNTASSGCSSHPRSDVGCGSRRNWPLTSVKVRS